MGDIHKPKISLVTVAYNRAHLIERSIKSVIKQTFTDWELILVDNGSTDNTKEVLQKYKTPEFENKIRIFHLEENRKFAGGINFGMDQIRGEWFTWHDDDDEIVPECLETLLRVPEEIDPTINAVTCNCIDTSTNAIAGHGIDKDGYLTYEHIKRNCTGEFFGITKTELLGDKRLNEKLLGYECTLWNRIDRIANRYYVHKPLRIWYQGHPSIIKKLAGNKNVKLKAEMYRQLAKDQMYWEDLKEFNPNRYFSKMVKAMYYLYADGDRKLAGLFSEQLKQDSKSLKYSILARMGKILPKGIIKSLIQVVPT